jgi:hypothetical protein
MNSFVEAVSGFQNGATIIMDEFQTLTETMGGVTVGEVKVKVITEANFTM